MNLMVVAGQLWSMFRTVINQALEGIASELGDGKDRVLEVIDEKIAEFFYTEFTAGLVYAGNGVHCVK